MKTTTTHQGKTIALDAKGWAIGGDESACADWNGRKALRGDAW